MSAFVEWNNRRLTKIVQSEPVCTFNTLRVYVSYRMDAGGATPKWKALRARVKQHCILGSDLTRQGITNLDMLIAEALYKLGDAAEVVEFEIDPRVKNSDGKIRRYLHGHFIGYLGENLP